MPKIIEMFITRIDIIVAIYIIMATVIEATCYLSAAWTRVEGFYSSYLYFLIYGC